MSGVILDFREVSSNAGLVGEKWRQYYGSVTGVTIREKGKVA